MVVLVHALEELGDVLRQGFRGEGNAHTRLLAPEDLLLGAVACLVRGGVVHGQGAVENFSPVGFGGGQNLPDGRVDTFSSGLRKAIALRAISLPVDSLGAGDGMSCFPDS